MDVTEQKTIVMPAIRDGKPVVEEPQAETAEPVAAAAETVAAEAADAVEEAAVLAEEATAAETPDAAEPSEPAEPKEKTAAEKYEELSPEDRMIYDRIKARKEAQRKAKLRRKRRIRMFIAAVLAIVLIAVLSVQFKKLQAARAEKAAEEARIAELVKVGGEGSDGDVEIVKVAVNELGKTGGEKYWTWWGFDSYVDWNSLFVSWVGDRCSDEISSQVPRFDIISDGSDMYKDWGKWLEGGKMPLAGYIIFFDYANEITGERDGVPDHVGIVSGTFENNKYHRVFTIEGNAGYSDHGASRDAGNVTASGFEGEVRRKGYDVDDPDILGYGVVGEFPVYDEDI